MRARQSRNTHRTSLHQRYTAKNPIIHSHPTNHHPYRRRRSNVYKESWEASSSTREVLIQRSLSASTPLRCNRPAQPTTPSNGQNTCWTMPPLILTPRFDTEHQTWYSKFTRMLRIYRNRRHAAAPRDITPLDGPPTTINRYA